MITVGQIKTDHINRMLTIMGHINLGKFDHINRMITLSVITLSGFHYTIILTAAQNNINNDHIKKLLILKNLRCIQRIRISDRSSWFWWVCKPSDVLDDIRFQSHRLKENRRHGRLLRIFFSICTWVLWYRFQKRPRKKRRQKLTLEITFWFISYCILEC